MAQTGGQVGFDTAVQSTYGGVLALNGPRPPCNAEKRIGEMRRARCVVCCLRLGGDTTFDLRGWSRPRIVRSPHQEPRAQSQRGPGAPIV